MLSIKKPLINYIIALLLFGLNGSIVAQIHWNSHLIVLCRTFIGSFGLILFFIGTIFINKLHRSRAKEKITEHVKKPNVFNHITLLLSGCTLGISWLFLYAAFPLIGVGSATLAYYCGPVIVMILSPFLFGETITPPKFIAFISVIVGMLCVNSNVATDANFNKGLLFGLIAACLFATMILLGKKKSYISGVKRAMLQLLGSMIPVLIYCFFTDRFFSVFQMLQTLNHKDMAYILFLGLINTALGGTLYFNAIEELPLQTVSIVGYLEPLSAVFFSVLLIGEPMNLLKLIGSVLIIAGASLSEFRGPEKSPISTTANPSKAF